MPYRPVELQGRASGSGDWVDEDVADLKLGDLNALGNSIIDGTETEWTKVEVDHSGGAHLVYENTTGTRRLRWSRFNHPFHCEEDRNEEYRTALGLASAAIASMVVFAGCLLVYVPYAPTHTWPAVALLLLLIGIAAMTGLASKHYSRATSTKSDAGLRVTSDSEDTYNDGEVDEPKDDRVLTARTTLFVAFVAATSSAVVYFITNLASASTSTKKRNLQKDLDDMYIAGVVFTVLLLLVSFFALAVGLGCMNGYGKGWFGGEVLTTDTQGRCHDPQHGNECLPQKTWCRWNNTHYVE
jgi:amino acid transporter